MSKYRNIFAAVVRGGVVALQTVAAVIVPAKFADAATRDDAGAHKDRVATDEGLRFELDAKANAALAEGEVYVQVAQASQRSASDVVEEAVQVLADRGVNVADLIQAGALAAAVEQLVDSGDVAGVGDDEAGGVDVADVAQGLDVSDVQEILADS